jgi:hypothetical protein
MGIPIRRYLGWTFVVSLCFAALVAIIALLTSSFDDTDWRLIGTSLSFAVYSALAASGAAVVTKEIPAARPLGTATVAAAAVGFLLVLGLIWFDFEDGIARPWAIASLVALACSHASIVLRGARASDTGTISALVAASIALGVLDATVGTLAVAGAIEVDEEDPGVRLMAVTVVLLLLTTGLPPILRRLQPAAPARSWPPARGGSLEQLAAEVVAGTERIERHAGDHAAVRAECRRLRDLARSLGG